MRARRLPAAASLVLRLTLPSDWRDDIVRDLGEAYQRRVAAHPLAGRLWLLLQVATFSVRFLPARVGSFGGTVLPQALRSLRRRPGFSLGIVSLLGIGMGAVVTLTSLVDGILLRPLPYPDSDRLVFFTGGSHTLPDLEDWRAMTNAFEGIAGVFVEDQALGAESPVRTRVARMTVGFFDDLGASAALGRLPTDEEIRSGAPVAVVGPGLWAREWGEDPALVGRTIILDREPVTVIGVLSPSFRPPEALLGHAELWRSVDYGNERHSRDTFRFQVYGLLRAGIEVEQAQAEMDDVELELARRYPEAHATEDGRPAREWGPVSLHDATVSGAAPSLMAFLAASFLLLLVACANAASVVLARGTGRESELAIRTALGAGRGQLFGQVVAESVVLSGVAGLAGILLARLGLAWVRRTDAASLPLLADVTIEPRVVLATAGIAVLAGVAAGLLPALHASRTAPGATLRAGRGGPSRSVQRAQTTLVVGEVALTTVLMVGGGVLLSAFIDLVRVDPGFDPDPVLVVQVNFPQGMPEETRGDLAERMQTRLEGIPGVQAAGAGVNVPFDMTGGRCCWWAELQADGRTPQELWVRPVTAGYFEALGASVQGRSLTSQDAETASAGTVSGSVVPIVLNAPAAREVFGEGEMVGKVAQFDSARAQVVGVIDGTRFWGLSNEVEPAMYVPYSALGTWAGRLRFAVSVLPGQERAVAEALRPALSELDPSLAIDPVERLSERVQATLAETRLVLRLVGIFSAVALVLASAGLYGTLLYYVRQRRREMGIRLALGSGTGRVAGLVLRRGLTAVLVGLIIGGLGFLPVRRLLDGMLYQHAGSPTLVLMGVMVLLLLVGFVSTWVPARLAARSDPRTSLEVS